MEIKKADSKGRVLIGAPGDYFYVVSEENKITLIRVPEPFTVVDNKVQLTEKDLEALRAPMDEVGHAKLG